MSKRRKANIVTQSGDSIQQQCYPLLKALESLKGQATFANLGDVFQIAAARFGFNGTIDEAAVLLQQHPGLRVETANSISELRIYNEATIDGSSDSGATRPSKEFADEYPNELFDEVFSQARQLFENEFRSMNSPQRKSQSDK